MKKIGFLVLLAIAMMACEKADDLPSVIQSDAEPKTEVVKSSDEDATSEEMDQNRDGDGLPVENPDFIKPTGENKGDQ